MDKKDVFTKILAWVGTILVWIPILVPILFSVVRFIEANTFQIDYLMPAELSLVALSGGGLLLLVALLRHRRRGLIGGSLGAAAGLLIGALALAVITGLASGETEAVGWPFALVNAFLILYALALVTLGISGVLLLRD